MARSHFHLHARNLFAALGLVMALLYFTYLTLQGDRGLMAFMRNRTELRQEQEKLESLTAERKRLEKRVSQLRGESIDPDLLEEQTRLKLNLVHPDDVVVFTPPSMQERSEKSAP
jgi:cell division protein FtsB